MNKEHFFEALEIISKHHTSKVTINQPINNFGVTCKLPCLE